jgi:hypothetical protein
MIFCATCRKIRARPNNFRDPYEPPRKQSTAQRSTLSSRALTVKSERVKGAQGAEGSLPLHPHIGHARDV